MKARAKVRIFGIVQGVGFRSFIFYNAKELGLKGYVKNLKNGSLEAVFEGEENCLEKMIKICKKGPILSKIENFEVVYEKFKNEFEDFKILY